MMQHKYDWDGSSAHKSGTAKISHLGKSVEFSMDSFESFVELMNIIDDISRTSLRTGKEIVGHAGNAVVSRNID